MVVVLDRPRHEEGIAAIRAAGARVRLIAHGDVSAALLAVTERSPVDLLWGIGGTPEGVISAAAVKCLGGQLLGRLWPRDETERAAALAAGYDLERVLDRDDLVAGEDVFFSATGITDGDVLQGVRYPSAGGATTESLVTRRARERSGASGPPTTAPSCARSAASAIRPEARRREPRAATTRSSGLLERQGSNRPTRDSARSRRASERRNAWVTITWMRDWVALYRRRPSLEAIDG